MSAFYDNLAADYEAAVDHGPRLAAACDFLRRLHAEKALGSFLDVACGTGLYALAAAGLGAGPVAGADLSGPMLEVARAQASATHRAIAFHAASMTDLTRFPDAAFDTLVCMGNSLPHLTDNGLLAKAFREFRRTLAPGGRLAIQLLNYTRILAGEERIVGVARQNSAEFVRFYDFLGELVRFNLLRIDWSDGAAKSRLDSVLLRPFEAPELLAELHRCGFRNPVCHGGLDFSPFSAETSETLLITA